MAGSVIFATSYIAANENKMLTQDKLLRMLDGTANDAVKVLYEVPYADGYTLTNIYDYEKLLKLEEQKLYRFIKEICPSDSLQRFMLLKNDYHNVKVLLKARYGKLTSQESLLSEYCNYGLEFLQNSILNESYSFLSEGLKQAIAKLDTFALTQKVPPQMVDLALDRSYAMELSTLVNEIRSKTLYKYFTVQVDLANLLTIFRLRKLGEDIEILEYFVPGGGITQSEFVSYYELSSENLMEAFRYSEYKEYVTKLVCGNFFEFEKLLDNSLLGLFFLKKRENFTLDPILGYYFAKCSELKNVRIIMTGLISNIDPLIIKERLRDSYV